MSTYNVTRMFAKGDEMVLFIDSNWIIWAILPELNRDLGSLFNEIRSGKCNKVKVSTSAKNEDYFYIGGAGGCMAYQFSYVFANNVYNHITNQSVCITSGSVRFCDRRIVEDMLTFIGVNHRPNGLDCANLSRPNGLDHKPNELNAIKVQNVEQALEDRLKNEIEKHYKTATSSDTNQSLTIPATTDEFLQWSAHNTGYIKTAIIQQRYDILLHLLNKSACNINELIPHITDLNTLEWITQLIIKTRPVLKYTDDYAYSVVLRKLINAKYDFNCSKLDLKPVIRDITPAQIQYLVDAGMRFTVFNLTNARVSGNHILADYLASLGYKSNTNDKYKPYPELCKWIQTPWIGSALNAGNGVAQFRHGSYIAINNTDSNDTIYIHVIATYLNDVIGDGFIDDCSLSVLSKIQDRLRSYLPNTSGINSEIKLLIATLLHNKNIEILLHFI